MSDLGEAVVRGESLAGPKFDELDVALVPVHQAHLPTELFAMWTLHNVRVPRTGEIVQIVPGASWFCRCHERSVRRFDEAGVAPPRRPNRAQRRARAWS